MLLKEIINVPVTIIPFDVLKLKVLTLLADVLSDLIKNDPTDAPAINGMTEKMKEFFDVYSISDKAMIDWFKKDADSLFDPILFPYYEKNAVMVFVELKGELYPLYELKDDELASYGSKVKVIK